MSKVIKSAITGKFVSKATLVRHPNTTYQQTVNTGGNKGGKK